MDSFLIITNDGKDKDLAITNKIKEKLEAAGKYVLECEKNEDNHIIVERLPQVKFNAAIVIGGDGTMIQAARYLYELNIPLLGVNMGTLGYLTEVELANLDEALEKLLHEDYFIEERLMLQATAPAGDSHVAINDVFVTKRDPLRPISFNIFVNGQLLNHYDADGIIISSPTGSTAYNLSAGGPIVEPTASLLLITPVCAHALSAGSIVLSGDDTVEIEVCKGKRGQVQTADLAFDGQSSVCMVSGDKALVKKAENSCKIIKMSNRSFVEILGQKMKGTQL